MGGTKVLASIFSNTRRYTNSCSTHSNMPNSRTYLSLEEGSPASMPALVQLEAISPYTAGRLCKTSNPQLKNDDHRHGGSVAKLPWSVCFERSEVMAHTVSQKLNRLHKKGYVA